MPGFQLATVLWGAFALSLGLACVAASAAVALRRSDASAWAWAFGLLALRSLAGLVALAHGPSPALSALGGVLGPTAGALFALGAWRFADPAPVRPAFWLFGAALCWGVASRLAGVSPALASAPAEALAALFLLAASRKIPTSQPLLLAGLWLLALRSLAHPVMAATGYQLWNGALFGLWMIPAAGMVGALLSRGGRETLREQRRSETLADMAGAALAVTDEHGRVVHVGAGVAELLGCPVGELLGRALIDVLETAPAQVAERRELPQGDGTVWVLAPASSGDLPQIPAPAGTVRFVVEPGTGLILAQTRDAGARFGTGRGSAVRDFWALAEPGAGALLQEAVEEAVYRGQSKLQGRLRDKSGKLADAGLEIAETLWNRREAWRIDVASDAADAPETALIAHDVKNVFQVILASAEGLLRRGEATGESLTPIFDAARAGGGLARRLFDPTVAGRRGVFFDPPTLCQRTAAALEAALLPGVTLQCAWEPGLPPTAADEGEVEQALLNLLMNARDAVGLAGVIRLSATAEEGRVVFTVEDDGPGVSPELAVKLGRPGVTSKGPGSGTGLGLVMCRVTAQRYGGDLAWGASALGGARFALTLPVFSRKEDATPAAILLVDPDDACRAELDRLLKLAGRETHTAPDAERGLELLAQPHRRIGAVVFDLALPGLGGRGFLEKLREAYPQVDSYVYSTVGAESARRGALALGAREFFSKDQPPEAVARVIMGENPV